MSTVVCLILITPRRGNGIARIRRDTIAIHRLADERRHSVGVPCETWGGVVGSAGTIIGEGIGCTGIKARIAAAKSPTGIDLALAPLRP